MKVSNETLGILKNFASINSNISVKTGSKLKTMSPTKQTYVEATISEKFAAEFGIFDLNKFLATVSLFKDAEFDFQEKAVKISGPNGASVNYYYADTSLLTVPPATFKPPEFGVGFTLTSAQFAELMKASAVLQVPDLCIYSKDKKIFLKVTNKKDVTSNFYEIEVPGDTKGKNFTLYYKVEGLKLIPSDYLVGLSEKKMGQFKHKTLDLTYWIMMETDSVWN